MSDKNLPRRTFLKHSVAAGGLAGTLGFPMIASAKTLPDVTWRMQALWDGGTTPMRFEEMFVKRVAELTNGKFNIRLFSGGQLVPSNKGFAAVRSGAFELLKTYDGYAAGRDSVFAFTSSVPFGFELPAQYSAWFYERGGLEIAREAYHQYGMQYIAPTIYGQEPIHSTFPIHTLDDIKDKKGRFVGFASKVMGSLGVSVVPAPTAEVYTMLAQGIIDFADRGGLSANYDVGLYEVAKYVVVPGMHQPTTATSYVANQAAYDALPQVYKDVLMVAAKEVSSAFNYYRVSQDPIELQKFKDKGCEVIWLDREFRNSGREKAHEVWQETARGNELAEKALKSQVKFLKQLGYFS